MTLTEKIICSVYILLNCLISVKGHLSFMRTYRKCVIPGIIIWTVLFPFLPYLSGGKGEVATMAGLAVAALAVSARVYIPRRSLLTCTIFILISVQSAYMLSDLIKGCAVHLPGWVCIAVPCALATGLRMLYDSGKDKHISPFIKSEDKDRCILMWLLCFVAAVLSYSPHAARFKAFFICILFFAFLLKSETVYLRLASDYSREKDASERLSDVSATLSHEIIDNNELSVQRRMLWHDYKHQLYVLYDLLRCKNYDSAKGLAQQLCEDASLLELNQFCANPYVNVILSQSSARCRSTGIKFSADCIIAAEVGIKASHLTSLLFNLLNNAYEACQKLDESANRYIDVSIIQFVSNIVFFVKNSAPNKVQIEQDGTIVSSKADHEDHGLGLSIVKRIADEYSGCLKIEASENEFCIKVLITEQ